MQAVHLAWPSQWHPFVIHFPIALLFVEALFLGLFLVRRKTEHGEFALWLLGLAALSLIPVVVSGLYDAGADLGPGWRIVNGYRDRLDNLFRLESTVSVHVLLALPVVVITWARLAWRLRSGPQVLAGLRAALFLGLGLVALTLLTCAAYVGGSISHS